VALILLFGSDPPRYRLLFCLLPFFAGIVVGVYLGSRSFCCLSEEGQEDVWRVVRRGSLAPRRAFTDDGWRFRIYAGIAVITGWLSSGLLTAWYGF
jgi:hypothetical protein